MNRRTFLQVGTAGGVGALAGCLGVFETRKVGREPPMVEDRPDAVYRPTHVEGMAMAGMGKRGRLRLGLMYSFPHRFWLMGGGTSKQQEKVTVEEGDDAHVMATLWDAETKRVLPVGDVRIELSKGGESETRTMWPMLSQNMGFHFGDNMPLLGDGTYEAAVSVGGLGARRTGALAGQFGGATTLSAEFEYSESTKENLKFQRFEKKEGTKGAVNPMDMKMPLSHVPPKSDLPGRFLGKSMSGDAAFLVTAIEEGALASDGTYLAVSPRTPYNRYPLPMMSLSATLQRGGRTVFDGNLNGTLDPDLGLHYGATVDGAESGDELTLRVDSVPQVSRHEGYETAFRSMPKMRFTV